MCHHPARPRGLPCHRENRLNGKEKKNVKIVSVRVPDTTVRLMYAEMDEDGLEGDVKSIPLRDVLLIETDQDADDDQ